ncbi:DUF2835 family protein [Marinomonas sp. 2405UD68-3]|uniref:DUF2835 family protein n=1 Tax=Marinomonas sp. 2405UD68-3 TaxID=3391835 RepID=UPI0039C92C61
MAKIVLDVSVSAFKFKEMYRGTVKNLMAKSRDGRNVQLPLQVFKSFVTHQGLYGTYEVEFDDKNKLVGVKKIG